MRILFSSTAGLGHVLPMLPLASALRDRDHEIVWATAPNAHATVRQEGFATVAAGPSWQARRDAFRARFPEWISLRGEARVDHGFPRLFGATGTREMFEALSAFAAQWRPALIVSEAAELAGPAVGKGLGIPHVTHGFGLVVPPHRLQAAADHAAEAGAAAGEPPSPFGGSYDYAYIDPYPPSMQREDLSYISRIYRIRPAAATAAGHSMKPDWLARLLRDGRRLVYATCGTIYNEPELLLTVAAALGRRVDVVAVITVGPGADPLALGPQPEHVHVTDYVPQSMVLPAASLVVSHAGSGTLLGALTYGVPQVCVPQAADQLRNTRAAQQAGAAIGIFPDELTAESLAGAIDMALSSPEMHANARRVADEIAAMPPPATVAQRIERLVAGQE